MLARTFHIQVQLITRGVKNNKTLNPTLKIIELFSFFVVVNGF